MHTRLRWSYAKTRGFHQRGNELPKRILKEKSGKGTSTSAPSSSPGRTKSPNFALDGGNSFMSMQPSVPTPVFPTVPTLPPISPTIPITLNPTEAPIAPTRSPSFAPTRSPSIAPTRYPSKTPTMAPIQPAPVEVPIEVIPTTNSPVVPSPISAPTVSPVAEIPTENPTGSKPTEAPVGMPPTLAPTFSPSKADTTSPTSVVDPTDPEIVSHTPSQVPTFTPLSIAPTITHLSCEAARSGEVYETAFFQTVLYSYELLTQREQDVQSVTESVDLLFQQYTAKDLVNCSKGAESDIQGVAASASDKVTAGNCSEIESFNETLYTCYVVQGSLEVYLSETTSMTSTQLTNAVWSTLYTAVNGNNRRQLEPLDDLTFIDPDKGIVALYFLSKTDSSRSDDIDSLEGSNNDKNRKSRMGSAILVGAVCFVFGVAALAHMRKRAEENETRKYIPKTLYPFDDGSDSYDDIFHGSTDSDQSSEHHKPVAGYNIEPSRDPVEKPTHENLPNNSLSMLSCPGIDSVLECMPSPSHFEVYEAMPPDDEEDAEGYDFSMMGTSLFLTTDQLRMQGLNAAESPESSAAASRFPAVITPTSGHKQSEKQHPSRQNSLKFARSSSGGIQRTSSLNEDNPREESPSPFGERRNSGTSEFGSTMPRTLSQIDYSARSRSFRARNELKDSSFNPSEKPAPVCTSSSHERRSHTPSRSHRSRSPSVARLRRTTSYEMDVPIGESPNVIEADLASPYNSAAISAAVSPIEDCWAQFTPDDEDSTAVVLDGTPATQKRVNTERNTGTKESPVTSKSQFSNGNESSPSKAYLSSVSLWMAQVDPNSAKDTGEDIQSWTSGALEYFSSFSPYAQNSSSTSQWMGGSSNSIPRGRSRTPVQSSVNAQRTRSRSKTPGKTRTTSLASDRVRAGIGEVPSLTTTSTTSDGEQLSGVSRVDSRKNYWATKSVPVQPARFVTPTRQREAAIYPQYAADMVQL